MREIYKLKKDLFWFSKGTLIEKFRGSSKEKMKWYVVDKNMKRGNKIVDEIATAIDYFIAMEDSHTIKPWLDIIQLGWQPKMKESYYYVSSKGQVGLAQWRERQKDSDRYIFGNCFRHQEDALEAQFMVKATLETLHRKND